MTPPLTRQQAAIWALALPAAVLATTHAHTSVRARALEALQPLERPVRVHGLVYDIVSRKLRNLHVSVTVGEAGATA